MSYLKLSQLKAKIWMKWSKHQALSSKITPLPIVSISQKAMILEAGLELRPQLECLEACHFYLNVMGRWKCYELKLETAKEIDQHSSVRPLNLKGKYCYVPFSTPSDEAASFKRDLLLAYGR